MIKEAFDYSMQADIDYYEAVIETLNRIGNEKNDHLSFFDVQCVLRLLMER